jgi:hypothetical protein
MRISYPVAASSAGQYPHPRVYLRSIFDLKVDGTARGGKFGFVIAVDIEELGCAVVPVAHWDKLATCRELSGTSDGNAYPASRQSPVALTTAGRCY